MIYARSLRAIGQSLQMLRLQTFTVEKTGEFYIVRSDSLTPTHHWILRNSLTGNISHSSAPDSKSTELAANDGSLYYGPAEIAGLNARQQQTRGNRNSDEAFAAHNLAQLLRALGEHLDSKEASAIKISWALDAASVEYQTPDGVWERKHFSLQRLHQLALHSKLRRSSHNNLIVSQ